MITIIGLGPADAGALTAGARAALRRAPRLYVRTERHPAVDDLRAEGVAFESLDALYESGESFDGVYDAIVEKVLAAAAEGDVALAVPGHPLVAEESVRRLLARAREAGISARVVGAASFLEPALEALGLSVGDGLLLLDALVLERIPARPDVDLLLYQVYDRSIASAVKLELMKQYPDEWEVTVVRQAGVPGAETVERVPLHRLDRVEADHLTVVYVPVLPKEKRKTTLDDLVWVMARLRAEDGCPWDREQDHVTLKKYMIEECYEALEAIDADDVDGLAEELGDVMLQVVFHAQLEAEVGTFTIDDVLRIVVEKLIRRHPHVFGEVAVEGTEDVLRNWEQIKREEKGEGWRKSVLDGVPKDLPALMKALKISKKAVKVGFEWERFEDVLAKMDEEAAELREAIAQKSEDAIFAEIGDLLFTIVNIARWQHVDPEEALRQMIDRFSARFRFVEDRAREQGKDLTEMTLAEMDALWEMAKAASRVES